MKLYLFRQIVIVVSVITFVALAEGRGALASDGSELLEQIGSLSIKYNLSSAITAIEICPDTTCEYFEFGVAAPKGEAINLLMLQMYFVSTYWVCEKWRLDDRVIQQINNVLESDQAERCRSLYKANQKSAGFCLMSLLIDKYKVRYYDVRYDYDLGHEPERFQDSGPETLGPWCKPSNYFNDGKK